MGILPGRYDAWLREILGVELAGEALATCATCAMADELGDTKCCTYHPHLPSFVAGAVLAAGGGPAALLGARCDVLDGVTPLGVSPPDGFRFRADVCTFYDAGRCAIWPAREAVCATYFCRHERGQRGVRFWTAARDLLRAIEQRLSLWCLGELGIDAAACAALYLDGALPPAFHEDAHLAIWGGWLGAAADFFLAADRAVAGLGWPEVAAIAGADALEVKARFAELADGPLPAALAPAEGLLVQIRRPGGARVRAPAAASPTDFAEMPEAAAEALQRGELPADEALLRRLLDLEIILPRG